MEFSAEDNRFEQERNINLQRFNLILLVLNSMQIQTQVSNLPIEQVESLGEAWLDFTSLADLETWLSQFSHFHPIESNLK